MRGRAQGGHPRPPRSLDGRTYHHSQQLRRLVTADADVTGGQGLTASACTLLEQAALASRRRGIDPLDNAVLALADRVLLGSPQLHPDWRLKHEYALTPAPLAMSQVWIDDAGVQRIAAKGAPEAIAGLCHLGAARTGAWLQRVHALADQGLRVLAVARGSFDGSGELPTNQHDHDFELARRCAGRDSRTTGAAACGDRPLTPSPFRQRAGFA